MSGFKKKPHFQKGRPKHRQNPSPDRRLGVQPQRGNNEPPSPKLLAELLHRSGLALNSHQIDQLWKFHCMLRERNDDRDLTRITGFYPMVQKHYIDCMIIEKWTKLPSPLLDVGTGAGFPGIPLKIRHPDLELVLAEPRPKRVAFLNDVIRTLKLKKITVFDHKVTSRSYQKPMAGVITRAVETMDKTFLRTSAAVPVGGKYFFLKGPNINEEIQWVENRFPGHFKLLLKKHYFLPHTPHERHLLVYEKLKEPEEDMSETE